MLAGLSAVLLLQLAYQFTPRGSGDVNLYHRYALAFWTGSGAFHQLPVEYPPLALAPFTLTVLPPLPGDLFLLVYGLWMAAAALLLLWLLARDRGPSTAWTAALYLAAGCFATLLARYDLLPALATVGALLLAGRRRFGAAYLVLALGVLLKLYPAVLIPVIAAEQWRVSRSPRSVASGLAGAALLVAAGFGAAAILSPGAWLSPFRYASARPLQVESGPATLAWLASGLGVPLHPDHSFHSFNVTSPLAPTLVMGSAAVLLIAVVLAAVLVARGRVEMYAAAAVVVGAMIVTSKVFSPQYMAWLLPLVALAEGRPRRHWLAVCALTTVVFPVAYDASGLWGLSTPAAYPAPMLAAIAARNLLLAASVVALAVVAVREQRPARGHEEMAGGGARGHEVLGDGQPRPGHE